MTELKKLTVLVQEMEVIANELSSSSHPDNSNNNNNNNDDASQQQQQQQDLRRTLYDKSQEFQKTALNIRERTDRLLSRAREKDPDKQMYNENACAKIEALGVEVDRVLTTIVSEDRLDEIEREFLKFLREEAHARATAHETAKTIDSIVQQEKDARILLFGDEKVEWGSFLDQERKAKTEVYRIEGEKAQAKWKVEQDRRQQELENAMKAHQFALKNGAKEFVTKYFFEECILKKIKSDDDDKSENESDDNKKQKQVLSAVFYFILQRLSEILQALLRDPEQEGLKTMRTDGERYVKTFGHSHLYRFVVENDKNNNPNTSQEDLLLLEHSTLDKLISEATEVLLSGVGFIPSYTASTLLDGHWIESLVGFKSDMIVYEHLAKASRSVKRENDVLCFIYGNNNHRKNPNSKRFEIIHHHQTSETENSKNNNNSDSHQAPWFEYGDRRLTLKEPSITDEDPEVWMKWHENFKDIAECLDKFVLKDYKAKYLMNAME